MLEHNEVLRDGPLGLSTDHRLEAMGAAALEMGAWGAKVVGSGRGGCTVALSLIEKVDAVAKRQWKYHGGQNIPEYRALQWRHDASKK